VGSQTAELHPDRRTHLLYVHIYLSTYARLRKTHDFSIPSSSTNLGHVRSRSQLNRGESLAYTLLVMFACVHAKMSLLLLKD
jgi:hypothetical protein